MPSWWECDLALGEGLDLVAHNVDTTLIRCVQLENTFAVGVAQQCVRETVDRCCLADTRKALLVSYRLEWTKLTLIMMCGMLPSSAMTLSRSTVSLLPTMSERYCGRYFSTLSSASTHNHQSCPGCAREGRNLRTHLPWHLIALCIGKLCRSARCRCCRHFWVRRNVVNDAEVTGL